MIYDLMFNKSWNGDFAIWLSEQYTPLLQFKLTSGGKSNQRVLCESDLA